jgi:hypothetical protein
VANEEIFRHRFIHPFFKLMLFFNRPPAIADFPDLIRGFIQHLAEARSGGKNNQKENKKRHRFILKRMTEDCQPKERVKLWVASFVIESVKEAFITVIGKIKLHLRMTRYRK